jgi:hypothetical protein
MNTSFSVPQISWVAGISSISKGHGAFILERAIASKKWHLVRLRRCFRDLSKGQGDPFGIFWTLIEGEEGLFCPVS